MTNGGTKKCTAVWYVCCASGLKGITEQVAQAVRLPLQYFDTSITWIALVTCLDNK